MASTSPNPSLTSRELLAAWRRILVGSVPLLSIEITRECPLSCPGCYAYGETHLGSGLTLRELKDLRGDALVEGVLDLVRKHKPVHVSLVGGEPLVRHRELSRILPALSEMGVFTLVVTSAVIPIPAEWMKIPRLRVAVSVDGLPEHHDGNLRTHSQKHRRPRDQCPLGHYAPHAGAARLPGGVRVLLERAKRSESHLGERVHPTGW